MTSRPGSRNRAHGGVPTGRAGRFPAAPPGRCEALMAAAQAGDGAAYDTLLREALPMLRGMARRRIADPMEAEDSMQDTMLTLHRLRHTYDPSPPCAPGSR